MTNIERVQERLEASGIPALLVSDISNIRWATGFTGSFGFLLVTPTDARFLTDSRYALQAQEQVRTIKSFSFANPTLAETFIAEHACAMGLANLGFEATTVPYATYEKWRSALGGIELVAAKDILANLRMVKSEDEIGLVREACRLADACWDHVRRLVRVGISEYDLGLEIEFYFRRAGAGLAFEPIVVSGLRSARPHGRPSDKQLEGGDFVTFDFGANLGGMCSDLTRTIVVGKASERHKEIYETVLASQEAALHIMKPGIQAKAVDAEARRVMGDFAQYFGHGLGHGLGSVVHDGGRMGPTSTDVLEVGQIWTVEPGIYIESFGGVRIEDDVVITDAGIEILTRSDKALRELPEAF